MYVVGDCASLPHAPSAQLAEAQAEQIVQVLELRWKGEPLPEAMPKFKLKGVLGSLGKKPLRFSCRTAVDRQSASPAEIGLALDV